jgi:hypothetical protein
VATTATRDRAGVPALDGYEALNRHHIDLIFGTTAEVWRLMVAAIVREPAFREEFQTRPYEQQVLLAQCALDQVVAFLLVRARRRNARFGLPPMLSAVWRVVRDFTEWYLAFCTRHAGDFIHHESWMARRVDYGTIPGDLSDAALAEVLAVMAHGDPDGDAILDATIAAITSDCELSTAFRGFMWSGGCASTSPALPTH